MTVFLRWLGVAGIELTASGQVLLIDPYLSRIPLRKAYFGRIQPDISAVQRIEKCDYILVTHSHFDHLLDVPPIVKKTGARVFGSPNTERLLTSLGVSTHLIQTVQPGDNLSPGAFGIKVFSFEHVRLAGYNPGRLPNNLKPPLKARDYRMDYGCCYHISAGGLTFLTDPGYRPSVNLQANILFTQPYHDRLYYQKLLNSVRSKVVIPIHWDNLFSAIDPKPYFWPPAFTWPPLRRINLQSLTEIMRGISPDVKIIVPQAFKSYNVEDLLRNVRA